MEGNDPLTVREGDLRGLDVASLDTPALLVDLDLLVANIDKIAATCRRHGVNWRPHVKAVKVPEIAFKLMSAGAIGVTCAKLGEAEAIAAGGIASILIANQIVGPRKIARLLELRRKADAIVAIDHPDHAAALAAAARSQGVEVGVVVEMDIGIRRAGVASAEACLELVRKIARLEGVRFRGVMGWEGHAAGMTDAPEKARAVAAAVAELVRAADLCRAAGFPVDIVSCGGTGTYWLSAAQPGVTEIQAGGGIFGDVHYRKDFGVDHPYALRVLTTVISRPNPTRIICDAGKKAMSGDVALPQPLGLDARSVRLSAEHVTVELMQPSSGPAIGDRMEFVVGYSDTTVFLHDVLFGVRKGRVEEVWPVLVRSCFR